ncbi:MAG: energy transducer TonB [Aquificaceae bacterium]
MMFTLLSLYLSVRIEVNSPTPPLQVYVEDMPLAKEIKLAGGRQGILHKPREGEGITKKGKDKAIASPVEVSREKGDIQVPAGTQKEEPSLLQEIEQKVRGREREVEREGVKSADIGSITAVVSPGGVGLSGGGRATVYTPPLPRISSDEPLSPLRVRVWIEPSGVVSRVQIIQKSGSTQVDQKMVEFVRGIRFEAIRENTVQTGIITFRFKGG